MTNERHYAAALALCALALASCNSRSTSALPGLAAAQAAPDAALAPDAGGAPRWVPLGPFGVSGKMNAVAVDPRNAAIVYVAGGRGTGVESYSTAGIFKTTDRGRHWQRADVGLKDASGTIASTVNALWIDPKHPSVLLAATEDAGLFRSSDAAASWHAVYATTAATQIVASGTHLYAATEAGIVASNDDGATWSVQWPSTATRRPTALAAGGPAGNESLYAGTSDGAIYRSSGAAWTYAGKLPYVADRQTEATNPAVHQLAVDPLVPTTVYATSNDGRWNQDLHASTNGGRSWVTVDSGGIFQNGLGSQAIAFSATQPHRLYVGADGGFLLLDANGKASAGFAPAVQTGLDLRNVWIVASGKSDDCYLASDQGVAFVKNCAQSGGPVQGQLLSGATSSTLERNFIVSPDGKTIVLSPQDYGTFWTTDGGAHWSTNASHDYEDAFHELRPGNPSVCYAFDEVYGFRMSTNGCAAYSMPSGSQRNLYSSRLMTNPIAFDPKNPLHLYLASGDFNITHLGIGFSAGQTGVFESRDGGLSFAPTGWRVSEPGAVLVDPHDGGHVVVAQMHAHRASSLAVTFDGGKTWRTSAGVPPTAYWYSASISPANGNTVLASSVDTSGTVFVLRSTDGGKTFGRLGSVASAAIVAGHADTPRVKGYFLYSPQHGLRYNQDVTTGSPDVVLTTLHGAYLSHDDGTTWKRLDTGLVAHSFWGIRWRSGYLYLASDGQGILRSATPVQKP